ncbi:unnamed protein product [Caenorhabditis angaria]|uniref:Uncharacterized protein n=1 Tax=Caenorhabditis angaria TaxID=860376 RepID=A0A9P1IDL3_9PELO|nr:unnamed protein product [Caenorhabditis angaria]
MNPPKRISPYANAPKIFGLKFKIASRVMLYFEAILGKLLLVLSICSIIYSPTWYPVAINFAFLILFIISTITYNKCLSQKRSILAYPMISYEIVTIFWLSIWLYASLNAIATGYMFSLEWLGGPKTSRVPPSRDFRDINYANPNETLPETMKSIKYGAIISAVCALLIVLKMLAFVVARRTFFQIQKMQREIVEEEQKANWETESEISNIGGSSPSFPVAYKNRPPKERMAPLQEVEKEEYTPQPSPAPRRFVKKPRDNKLLANENPYEETMF